MPELHRRLSAMLALLSLLAFVSGAGLDAPSVLPAGVLLLLAVVVRPGERFTRVLEPLWRGAALLLAARAGIQVARGGADPVLPMVDLLLLLLCAESLRPRDGSGDARHFALTFALLIASAAYRPGPLFGLLFMLYVVCATLLLVVAHLNRQARARGLHAPAPRAPFLARVALLSTVILVVSAAVFLFFPRVSRGWAARATPMISRAVVGFSDRVSIGEHGATIAGNPEVVLRIEFPNGTPSDMASLHWRGRSYNRFDGVTWSRSSGRIGTFDTNRGWAGPAITQLVYGTPLGDAPVMFGLHPILHITPRSRIRPVRTSSDDYLYLGDVDPVYQVISRLGRPSADELRRVHLDSIPERANDRILVGRHLQLPPLTPRMLALADSFARSAPTMYDHVAAVEQWLRTEFTYTLDLPATRRETSLDHFLFERRAGHCEYFSTAMAVLLRAGGIPTRNVNGFLGGEWNEFGRFLTVTQNNAHSWVEVYFPGEGWVEFDPTPSGGTPGIAQGPTRFRGARQFLAGLEHRWGKWVLDYDLDTQVNLVERATAPFVQDGDAASPLDTAAARRLWPIVIIATALVVLVLVLRRLRFVSRQPHRNETRAYLRLRAAYERAGFPSAVHQPPLQFAAALGEGPGAAHARAAVELYVRSRFGGIALSDEERALLAENVKRARKELSRAARAD